jgi:glucose-6-phosphate isomerase
MSLRGRHDGGSGGNGCISIIIIFFYDFLFYEITSTPSIFACSSGVDAGHTLRILDRRKPKAELFYVVSRSDQKDTVRNFFALALALGDV